MNSEWEDQYQRLLICINNFRKKDANVGFYNWSNKWKRNPSTCDIYNHTNCLINLLKKQSEISKSKKTSSYILYSRDTMEMILLLKIAALWTKGQLTSTEEAVKCNEEIEIYLNSFNIKKKSKEIA